ncbi:MAG: flagellar motor switch protein FliN [Thermomicrobiales bacterium]
MTEDPRDQRPVGGDASGDEPDEDEITLDELEGESGSGFFNGDDEDDPHPDEPPLFPHSSLDDGELQGSDEDEITLDELDVDTAGYFEVSAVGGATGPAPQEERPSEGEAVFEVEAASAPRTGEEAPPDPDPPSPSRQTSYRQSSGNSMIESENIRRLQDVEVEVIATLGTTRMQIRDILGLHVGSVVELHKVVGEPVEVTLNGRLIARGEVVVVDEKFAVRVTEITGSES